MSEHSAGRPDGNLKGAPKNFVLGTIPARSQGILITHYERPAVLAGLITQGAVPGEGMKQDDGTPAGSNGNGSRQLRFARSKT